MKKHPLFGLLLCVPAIIILIVVFLFTSKSSSQETEVKTSEATEVVKEKPRKIPSNNVSDEKPVVDAPKKNASKPPHKFLVQSKETHGPLEGAKVRIYEIVTPYYIVEDVPSVAETTTDSEGYFYVDADLLTEDQKYIAEIVKMDYAPVSRVIQMGKNRHNNPIQVEKAEWFTLKETYPFPVFITQNDAQLQRSSSFHLNMEWKGASFNFKPNEKITLPDIGAKFRIQIPGFGAAAISASEMEEYVPSEISDSTISGIVEPAGIYYIVMDGAQSADESVNLLNYHSTTTNSEGRFQVLDVSAGYYWVTVYDDRSKKTKYASISFHLGKGEQRFLDLKINDKVKINGRFILSENSLSALSSIVVYDLSSPNSSQVSLEPDGRFEILARPIRADIDEVELGFKLPSNIRIKEVSNPIDLKIDSRHATLGRSYFDTSKEFEIETEHQSQIQIDLKGEGIERKTPRLKVSSSSPSDRFAMPSRTASQSFVCYYTPGSTLTFNAEVGGLVGSKTVETSMDGKPEKITIELGAGNSISGFVEDEAGERIKGVNVGLYTAKNEADSTMRESDENGYFEFRKVHLQEYLLGIVANEKYKPISEKAKVIISNGKDSIGNVLKVNVVSRDLFEGHVVDEKGEPLEGVVISGHSKEILTDAEGYFSFEYDSDKIPQLYLYFRKEGYYTKLGNSTFTYSDSPSEVVMYPDESITVRLTPSDKVGEFVTFKLHGRSAASVNTSSDSTIKVTGNTFNLKIENDLEYDLKVSTTFPDGKKYFGKLKFNSEEIGNEITVELESGLNITGRVINKDGEPVENALVEIRYGYYDKLSTNERGEFSIVLPNSSTIFLRATKGKLSSTLQEFETIEGEDLDLELVLLGESAIEGVISNAINSLMISATANSGDFVKGNINSEGEYRINAIPGTYSILVTGYGVHEYFQGLEVRDGESTEFDIDLGDYKEYETEVTLNGQPWDGNPRLTLVCSPRNIPLSGDANSKTIYLKDGEYRIFLERYSTENSIELDEKINVGENLNGILRINLKLGTLVVGVPEPFEGNVLKLYNSNRRLLYNRPLPNAWGTFEWLPFGTYRITYGKPGEAPCAQQTVTINSPEPVDVVLDCAEVAVP